MSNISFAPIKLAIIIVIIIYLVIKIFEIIGKWKVYKKALKPGWTSIIPIYNYWILIKISSIKWWYFIIILLAKIEYITNFIFVKVSIKKNFSILIITMFYFVLYCINYNISKRFNKNYLFALGLTFLPFIFYPILGFSNAKYEKEKNVSPYGVI